MGKGDKVVSLIEFEGIHMFPPKYEVPETITIPLCSMGIIESLYKDGSGIVRFDNGKRLLVSDLKNKFVTS